MSSGGKGCNKAQALGFSRRFSKEFPIFFLVPFMNEALEIRR